jgi:hypothetical protein
MLLRIVLMLPGYLPLYQFYHMLIGKAGDVEAIAHNLDHRPAI